MNKDIKLKFNETIPSVHYQFTALYNIVRARSGIADVFILLSSIYYYHHFYTNASFAPTIRESVWHIYTTVLFIGKYLFVLSGVGRRHVNK